MKPPTAKSAYLSWLATAIPARGQEAPVFSTRPDDLVLGYATGYDASHIAPFVRSLRAVYSGDVALVVDDRPDVAELLRLHQVRAVAPQALRGWEPHAVVARFAAYDRILSMYPQARSVLLTDVRDVLFQGGPFEPAPQRLETFVEFEQGTLAGHGFNMKHLKAMAGPEIADRLRDRPCLCVGTVAGPRAEVVRFCRTLLMLSAIPRSQVGGAFGADQAACNLAVHLGLVDAAVMPNYSRVATVGMSCPDGLEVKDGRLINPDGSASPIIHQHDRHPHMATVLHALWGKEEERRERRTRRTVSERGEKLKQSLLRRLPELR